jgi:hypothetical protein
MAADWPEIPWSARAAEYRRKWKEYQGEDNTGELVYLSEDIVRVDGRTMVTGWDCYSAEFFFVNGRYPSRRIARKQGVIDAIEGED